MKGLAVRYMYGMKDATLELGCWMATIKLDRGWGHYTVTLKPMAGHSPNTYKDVNILDYNGWSPSYGHYTTAGQTADDYEDAIDKANLMLREYLVPPCNTCKEMERLVEQRQLNDEDVQVNY